MIEPTILTDLESDFSSSFLLCLEYERDNLDIEYVNSVFHRLEQIGDNAFRIRLDPEADTTTALEIIQAAYEYLEIVTDDHANADQCFKLEVVF